MKLNEEREKKLEDLNEMKEEESRVYIQKLDDFLKHIAEGRPSSVEEFVNLKTAAEEGVAYYVPTTVHGKEYWPIPSVGTMKEFDALPGGTAAGQALFDRILANRRTFAKEWKQPFHSEEAVLNQGEVLKKMETQYADFENYYKDFIENIDAAWGVWDKLSTALAYQIGGMSFNLVLRRALTELSATGSGTTTTNDMEQVHTLWKLIWTAPRLEKDLYVFRVVGSENQTLVGLAKKPREEWMQSGWIDPAFLSTTINNFEDALTIGPAPGRTFYGYGCCIMCIKLRRGTPIFPMTLLKQQVGAYAPQKEIVVSPSTLYIYRGTQMWTRTDTKQLVEVQMYDASYYDAFSSKKPRIPLSHEISKLEEQVHELSLRITESQQQLNYAPSPDAIDAFSQK